MNQEPTPELIPVDQLLARVKALRESGYRLVHVTATRLPTEVELTYGFDRESQLSSLRLVLPSADPRIPSICAIFPCVVLYENEIHDLFKVQIEGMALDFHGQLYRTAVKFPFGTVKAPSKPAAAVVPKPAPAVTPAAALPK